MKKLEKDLKTNEYFETTRKLLGFHLEDFDCEWQGDHPVVEVSYMDYKVSIITRAELQQLMPEVELACVKRRISTTAQLHQLIEILYGGKYFNGDEAFVRKADTGEEVTLNEWAVSMLFNEDLSKEPLPYDDMERRDKFNPENSGSLCQEISTQE